MNKLVLLILTSMFLVAYTNKKATVEISVKGAGDAIITYCYPKGDLLAFGRPDTVTVADGQTARVEVETQKLTTVMLRDGKNYISLIVEPNKKYKICFNGDSVTVDDPVQTLRRQVMSGKNFHKYAMIRDWTQFPLDTVASNIRGNFESLLTADKKRYDGVKMSSEMREFINRDLEAYWMGSLSKAIRANYYRATPDKPMYDGFLDLWNEIYAKYPITETMIPSEYFIDFAQTKGVCEQANQSEYKVPKTFLEAYYNIDYLKTIESPNIRKALTAGLLYFVTLNNSERDVEVLDHINDFLATYPQPEYKKVFSPFVTELREFQASSKTDFSKGVHFVENPDSIKTFDDLLTQFKGKPLLIDFWFSTCSPCLKNFQNHGAALENFLSDNNITLLCVSVDRKDELWQNTIKHYNIKGHQIRASGALHEDFYNKHGINLYPNYMLVGADGEILIKRMKDLSENEAFYEQIKEALKL